MACAGLGPALLVPLQPQRPRIDVADRRRQHRRALPAPAARPKALRTTGCKAMHTSLNLYAEHEFNASTFTCPASWRVPARTCTRPSPAASARCAAPSTAAPTKWRSKCRSRYDTPRRGRSRYPPPRREQRGHHRLSGHPVYTVSGPAQQGHPGRSCAEAVQAGRQHR